MLFNSLNFILFFTVVVLLYYCIPVKYRYLELLVASYVFYAYSDYKNILVLLAVTIISFFAGKIVARCSSDKKKKAAIAVSTSTLIILLLYLKYLSFIMSCLRITLDVDNIIVPLGISFFILQAISYPIDVYRGDVKEEKNFFKYALFVSFFPQLLSGPIAKAKEMLPQYNEEHRYNSKNTYDGALLIIYGLFKKMVVADLIAVGVNNVYGDLASYKGLPLLIVVLLYSIQIYLDFSGYSNIAYGCGKILGFELNKNFNQPYFAGSVKNFWARWHMSLSTWFRDYLYIPLGGNRKGQLRCYLNLAIVFLVSGLWHGAAITYVVWGGLHALYQILEKRFKLNFKWEFLNIIKTNILVTFAWIFFRASTIKDAIYVTLNMFNITFSGIKDQIKSIGWDVFDLKIIAISCICIFVLELLNYKKEIFTKIYNLNYKWKLAMYFVLIFVILIFGQYGPGFENSNFLYLVY